MADDHSFHIDASSAALCEQPCEVVLVPIARISDEEIPGKLRWDVPALVARDMRGRLFIAGWEGVAVFDSSGALSTHFGERGSGPAEFQLPAMPLFGPGDSLHVFDYLLRRVQIFDPELRLGRTVGIGFPATVVLGDGSYVLATQMPTPEHIGYPVHLVNTVGAVVGSFGTDTPQYRPDLQLITNRIIAPSQDGTVWTVPPGRYVLERWDPLTGQRIHVVSPESAWFRETIAYPSDERVRPPAIVSGLWEDEHGLLWIVFRDADADWQPPPQANIEREITLSERAHIWDWVVEVVDPTTSRILASKRFDGPIWVHPQSRLLTSPSDAALATVAFDVWSAHLQDKETQP